MEATIRKKGKSLWIVFSKKNVKELGLHEGMEFTFKAEKGSITLIPVREPKKKL